MDKQQIKHEADIKRQQVKATINKLMGLPDEIQSELANNMVDDLITCMILEMCYMNLEVNERYNQSQCR